MADVSLNSVVENYIVEVDWLRDSAKHSDLRQRIVSWFEDGKLILLRNHPLIIDYDLLNSFEVPNQEAFRELNHHRLLYPKLWKSNRRRAILGTFGLNLTKYLRVRAEVQRVNAGLKRMTQDLLPGYRVLREQYSWRFLPTDQRVHPVHLDGFHGHGDQHYVRLFLNLDREPRVWHVADRLATVVHRDHAELDWAHLASLDGDEFCNHIGYHMRRKGKPPCHEIAFQQGDLWLGDTRKIPHGVVSGHRVVATHFWIDPASMADSSKRIDAQVATLKEHYADTAAAQ